MHQMEEDDNGNHEGKGRSECELQAVKRPCHISVIPYAMVLGLMYTLGVCVPTRT